MGSEQTTAARADDVEPSTAEGQSADRFSRLDELVRELALRHEALCTEQAALRAQLAEREGRIRELDESRADAVKRIDALITQIDRLEATFELSDERA